MLGLILCIYTLSYLTTPRGTLPEIFHLPTPIYSFHSFVRLFYQSIHFTQSYTYTVCSDHHSPPRSAMEGTNQATKRPRPLSSDSVSNMHLPKRHQPIPFDPSANMNQINQPLSFDGSSNIDPTNSNPNQQSPSTSYGSQSSPPFDGYAVPVIAYQNSLDKEQGNMVYVGIQRSEEDAAGAGGWIGPNTQRLLHLIESGYPMDPELKIE